MPLIRQASFAGGEIAPELWGNTSLQRRFQALRRCRNFIPSRSGAAVSRPGTEYRGALKFTNTTVRLVPFLYSGAGGVTPYLLEFGDLYVRPWQAFSSYDSYTGVDKATPYPASQLGQLGWAQEGNTLTLTHPSHPPQELKFDGATWTLAPVSFARPACPAAVKWTQPGDGTLGYGLPDADHPAKEWAWMSTQLEQDADGNVLESAPVAVDLSKMFAAWSAGTTYAKGALVSYGGAGYFVSLHDGNVGTPPGNYGFADPADPNWYPVDPSAPPIALYPDRPLQLKIVGTRTAVLGGTVIGFRHYRGVKGGPLGWVGDSGGPFGSSNPFAPFTDTGDDPDYSTAPPQGLNPFVRSGTTENPSAVAYYDQRRIFGGTASRPHTLFVSAIAEYANFDRPLVLRKDDAAVFSLASGRGEQIRSIISRAALLVLTSSSIWAVSGGDGPLAFDSVQAVPQSEIGASWLPGIAVGRALLYVRDGGTGVRSLAYSWERQGYTDLDLSFIAQHLVRTGTVVDWAYAADPWSTVWMVRSDGKLLSLTLARDEQEQEEGVLVQGPTGGGVRYAWAWHDTQGTVEAVCSMRVAGEDAVYLAVARMVNGATVRYLERLSDRVLPVDSNGTVVVEDAFALDCSKSITFAPDPPSATVGGLSHLEGLAVKAVADGTVVDDLTVSGGQVTLPVAASKVHVGLAFTPEAELLDAAVQGAEVSTQRKILSGVWLDVVQSRGLQVGPDADHLDEWEQRAVADSYDPIPYATEKLHILTAGDWNDHARVFMRQADPLPVTIASVVRDVKFGG